MTGAQSVPRSINHRQRHEARNIAPAIPKMKGGEIIRPHQPDKIDPGAALREMAQSVKGKVRTNRRFKITDDESGMISNLRTGLQPCWQIGQFARLFKRIAGRHQPPDAIEIKTAQSNQADQAMALMRGIEGAPQ